MSRPLRLGVMLPNDPTEVSAARAATHAEAAGFDIVAAGEHVFFPSATSLTAVSLASAAAATERIELLSSVLVAPMYGGPLLAKLAHGLDHASGGRFILGLGTGGDFGPEFAAMGIPVRQRGKRTTEACRVAMGLLSGGLHDGLGLLPTPTRVPPVWIGGRSAGSLRRVLEFADTWYPYMVSPRSFGRTLDQLRSEAATMGRVRSLHGALFAWAVVERDGARARASAAHALSTVYGRDMSELADRYVLAGTAAEVASRLRAYAAAGASAAVLTPAAGGGDYLAALDGLHDVLGLLSE